MRLLQPLLSVTSRHGIVFSHVVFTPASFALQPSSSTAPPDLSWQALLKQTWDTLPRPPPAKPLATVSAGSQVLPSSQATLAFLRGLARARPGRVQVLVGALPRALRGAFSPWDQVTGSLYLVGDFLRLLR